MEPQSDHTYAIMEICLLAGKIMLQNGAETNRVEDTMMRIAAAFGIKQSHSYVTPTGIIFSIDGAAPTRLIRISERSTDLHKVTLVNDLSRRMSSGDISLEAAHSQLQHIDAGRHTYSFRVQAVAAALVSGCSLIMFQGEWSDFAPAFVTGGMGFLGLTYLHRLVPVKFVAEFLTSMLIGLLALAFVAVGMGHDLDTIIIGSVMPLVPGLLITNAVRDLMAGHLVSGISKGAEALLTASAVGTGVAIVYAFQ